LEYETEELIVMDEPTFTIPGKMLKTINDRERDEFFYAMTKEDDEVTLNVIFAEKIKKISKV
jgi:hypothetical protein